MSDSKAWLSLIVEQDVKLVEHILVKQVCFVEEEDRMHAFAPEFFDMCADREEDTRGSR